MMIIIGTHLLLVFFQVFEFPFLNFLIFGAASPWNIEGRRNNGTRMFHGQAAPKIRKLRKGNSAPKAGGTTELGSGVGVQCFVEQLVSDSAPKGEGIVSLPFCFRPRGTDRKQGDEDAHLPVGAAGYPKVRLFLSAPCTDPGTGNYPLYHPCYSWR